MESEAKNAVIIALMIVPETFLLCCRNSFHPKRLTDNSRLPMRI